MKQSHYSISILGTFYELAQPTNFTAYLLLKNRNFHMGNKQKVVDDQEYRFSGDRYTEEIISIHLQYSPVSLLNSLLGSYSIS